MALRLAVVIAMVLSALLRQASMSLASSAPGYWFWADGLTAIGPYILQRWWDFPSPCAQVLSAKHLIAALLVSVLLGVFATGGHVSEQKPFADPSRKNQMMVSRVCYHVCETLVYLAPMLVVALGPGTKYGAAVQPELIVVAEHNEEPNSGELAPPQSPPAGQPHVKSVVAVSVLFVSTCMANVANDVGYPALLSVLIVVSPLIGKEM